jgi:hypothetical protein
MNSNQNKNTNLMFPINHELEVAELSLEQLEEIQGGGFFAFIFFYWLGRKIFGNDSDSQTVTVVEPTEAPSWTPFNESSYGA